METRKVLVGTTAGPLPVLWRGGGSPSMVCAGHTRGPGWPTTDGEVRKLKLALGSTKEFEEDDKV